MNLPSYATNLAVIDKNDNNKIINIAWGYLYDTSWLKENEDIIAADDLPITIGDIYNYSDGKFYRDGEVIRTNSEIINEYSQVSQILEEGEM